MLSGHGVHQWELWWCSWCGFFETMTCYTMTLCPARNSTINACVTGKLGTPRAMQACYQEPASLTLCFPLCSPRLLRRTASLSAILLLHPLGSLRQHIPMYPNLRAQSQPSTCSNPAVGALLRVQTVRLLLRWIVMDCDGLRWIAMECDGV